MSFTGVGRVIAVVLAVWGLLNGVVALVILWSADTIKDAQEVALGFANSTTGEMIDDAVYYVFVGLALGIACEISRRLEQIVMQLEKRPE